MKEDFAKAEVAHMLAQGLVEHTESEFASPCVLVDRKDNPDGSRANMRLCTDFRAVNNWTVRDAFPLPHIEDLIIRSGGAKYFSKIDLKSSFYQISLTDESRKYSAFVVPGYHVAYTVLPFGYINSSQKFQRFMTAHVLRELLHDRRVGNFIDDTWVACATEEECSQLTYIILERFAECGLIINLDKTQICVPEIKILGRTFDGLTATTRSECRAKALAARDPYDLQTLRSFVGLVNQFRDRIPNFSQIIRPLNDLKKKGVPFIWSEDCKKAKALLMEKITDDPILALPDWNKPFELSTDASHVGISACLYQRDNNMTKGNQLRLIGFYSYTFNRYELNYDVCQKEGLAVVKAVKYYRSYLEGRKFLVITDHAALLALKNMPEPRGKLARWIMFLMGFDMEIIHRKGSLQHDADAVSRLFVQSPTVAGVTHDSSMTVTDDMKSKLLGLFHDDPLSGGHSSASKTIRKIQARYTWPNMNREIEDYVKSCHVCQVVKHKYKPKIDYQSVPKLAKKPYETVHVDHGECMKKSEGVARTRSFVVIVDEYTRMTHAKAMNETAKSLIAFLEKQWFLPLIRKLISDNGTAFMSNAFQEFMKNHDIKHYPTSIYNPSANGLAEGKVKEIKKYVALYPYFPQGWRASIHAAAELQNRTMNRSIGCSPLHLLTGKQTLFPADKDLGITSESLLRHEAPLTEEQQLAVRVAEQQRRNAGKRFRSFKTGDLILYSSGFKGKSPIVKGPAEVIKVIERDGHAKTLVIVENGNELPIAVKNAVKYWNRQGPQAEQFSP